MRFGVVLVGLVMAGCATSQKAQAPRGTVLTSQEDAFTVEFPAGFPPAQKEVSTEQTDAGPVQLSMYVSESNALACLVSRATYPAALFTGPESEQAMLAGALSGITDGGKFKVDGLKDHRLQDHAARSLVAAGESEGHAVTMRVTMAVVPPHLYQLNCTGVDGAAVGTPEIDGFFQSFRVTNIK